LDSSVRIWRGDRQSLALSALIKRGKVRFHHLAHELVESSGRFPSEHLVNLGRVAHQLFNAVLTYYSDRPTFVWTRNTPDQYRQAALQRASYAIVTLPQPPAGGILGVVNRFRHAYDRQPESVDWLESAGFEKVAMEEGFVAYRRK
jgi:hypothetical protein